MNDSQNAYERIVAQIQARLIRSIWRIVGRSADAEDALQDALLDDLEALGPRGGAPFPEALVLKIGINAACDLARRRLRDEGRAKSVAAVEGASGPALSPADELAQAELRGVVLAAIARLPRRQSAALLMRVVEELPYAQVAAAIGCSEATARKHVARATVRLQGMLARWQPNHPTRS